MVKKGILLLVVFFLSCRSAKPVLNQSPEKLKPEQLATINEFIFTGKIIDSKVNDISNLNVNKITTGGEEPKFIQLVHLDKDGNFELKINDTVAGIYNFKKRFREEFSTYPLYLGAGHYIMSSCVKHPKGNFHFYKIEGKDTIPVKDLYTGKADSIETIFFTKLKADTLKQDTLKRFEIENETLKQFESIRKKIDPVKEPTAFSYWRIYYLSHTRFNILNNPISQPITVSEFDKILDDFFIPYPFDITDEKFNEGLYSFLINRQLLDKKETLSTDYRDLECFISWISTLKNKGYRDYFIIKQMSADYSNLDKFKNKVDSLESTGLRYENQLLLNGIKKKFEVYRKFSHFDQLPNVPLVDLYGNKTSLYKLNTPLKILSIYDHECLPCREDNSIRDSLSKGRKDIPPLIIVSRNQDFAQTIKEYQEMEIPFKDVYFVTNNDFGNQFNFLHYPSYKLLNQFNFIVEEDYIDLFGEPEYFNELKKKFNRKKYFENYMKSAVFKVRQAQLHSKN